MAIHDLTTENLAFHRDRINSLKPQSQRQWGEMSVERMMRHLRRTIELTLDDPNGEVKVVAPPIIRDIVGFVFFDVMTKWPKGFLKASPEFVQESAGPFGEEKEKLLAACDDFAKRCAANPDEKHIHPLTGDTPLKRIAHLHGVHMNHHYRQFGVV